MNDIRSEENLLFCTTDNFLKSFFFFTEATVYSRSNFPFRSSSFDKQCYIYSNNRKQCYIATNVNVNGNVVYIFCNSTFNLSGLLVSGYFFLFCFFLFGLDVPHLTNEHIASLAAHTTLNT